MKSKSLITNQRPAAERSSGLFAEPVSYSRLCCWSLIWICLIIAASALALPASADASSSLWPSPSKDNPQAPVMLAQSWDQKADIKGWWMSEKLDGVRGYWTGNKLISRSGIPFQAPEWFIRNFPATPLDGELWLGRQQFSELVSIVRRKAPDAAWKKVRYLIFDAPRIDGGFEKRLAYVRLWFQRNPNPYADVLQQQVCENEAHLRKKLRQIESIGGEGLMLRKPNSPYEVGRSSNLLKVKTYEDAEATVIGHLPGSGKHAGRLGALRVELPNGIRFSIGTGFSDRERDNPPPIGSIVTFKYYGYHKSGIPRFASFLRVRAIF